MRMKWLRATLGTVTVILLGGGGCTKLLDHETKQCQTDADCEHFLHHPRCDTQQAICVATGFQPAKCFFPEPPVKVPETLAQFLNVCTLNALPGGREDGPGNCASFQTQYPDAGISDPPPAQPPPPNTRPAPTKLCRDLVPAGGSVLYLTGSSNFQPLLQELAPTIIKNTGIRPVFRITTSCAGVRSMNTHHPMYPTDHFIRDPVLPTESYAQIFLGADPAVNCLLGSTTAGVAVDIGESEIYPATCDVDNNPDEISEGLGPILPIVFAVPRESTARVISAAAARQVFGGGGGVPPWTDPNFLYVRGSGTATLRLVANEIGLVPEKVWGIDKGSAGNVATSLTSSGSAAPLAIGILGSDYYDFVRGPLKALGFQATAQDCAFVPDSSLTSLDKINVRDGHYPLWGRIHFYLAKVNNAIASEPGRQFVELLTRPDLDPEILDAFIAARFVPPCAMNVRRDSELGPFTYQDPAPFSCACLFDAEVNPNKSAPPLGCTPCTSNGDCPAERPSCNYQYCEKS